jgi:TRAP-type C4-dicarboxylate transport system permease small subunit
MLKSIFRWLHIGAEGVAAAMLAVMFLTFLLQIFSRYVLVSPFGWTLEFILTLWVWLIFWGNAFVVKDQDHVTFDIVYLAVRPGLRRIFALIISASISIGLAISLYPTWDYIDFLKIKKSATLKIPLNQVFSIYAIFLVAVIIAHAYRFYKTLRHGAPEDRHLPVEAHK